VTPAGPPSGGSPSGGSPSGGSPAAGLAAAVDRAGNVGAGAGLDPQVARREAAAFAAAVAEAAPGAARDWVMAFGGTTQTLFEAAVGARRWRGAPTDGLLALVEAGSPAAGDYARALVDVAAAACALGTPTPRVAENASVASAAQLAVAGPRPSGAPSPGPGTSLEPAARAVPYLPSPPSTSPAARDVADSLALLNVVGDALSRLTPPPGYGPIVPPSGSTPSGLTPGPAGPVGGPPGPAGGPAAAATAGVAPAAPAPEEPPARTVEELLAELDALTGLERVKSEIHRQTALLRVEKLRAEAGLRSATITRHLVFLGNPGTGKTTVGRLVAGIYRAIGLLSKGQLVEVDRSELVAGYLGQTATKTGEVVASALGGVLFIDEAYSLAGDQYGEEAIDTLVKEMEDHRDDLVVVVAGYPLPMAAFIDSNPGLASRFRTVIDFADYTDDELVQIFDRLAADADYAPTDDARSRFREILADTPRGEGFGNGRFARNVLEAAIGRHAWRLRDVVQPTVDQLRQLLAEDLSESEDPPATEDLSAAEVAEAAGELGGGSVAGTVDAGSEGSGTGPEGGGS